MSDELRLWGVTTLIKLGVPNEALTHWAANTTAEYAVNEREGWLPLAERDPEAAYELLRKCRFRSSGKAKDRGTSLHDYAEQRALGVTPDVPEGLEEYVVHIDRFLDEHKPKFLLAEAPVYNLTLGYAGTLDAVVEIDGKTCVLDMKTTDKLPDARSRPPYSDIALQLVAYARAEQVGLTPPQQRQYYGRRYYVVTDDIPMEPMPKVDGALALVISPVDYRLLAVRIDDEVWQGFKAAREVARWSAHTSKNVLGPEVVAA